MNTLFPLLALFSAQRLGDSPSDAGRIALISLMIRPPIFGLLIAMIMAKQAVSAATVTSTNTAGTNQSSAASRGAAVLERVTPKPAQIPRFFPSFIGLTQKQAIERANRVGLNPRFVDRGDGPREHVLEQDPLAGEDWPQDVDDVGLVLGKLRGS